MGCPAVSEGPPVAVLTLGRHLLSDPGAPWAPLSCPKRGQSISEHVLFSEGEADGGLETHPVLLLGWGRRRGRGKTPARPGSTLPRGVLEKTFDSVLCVQVQEEFSLVYLRASGGEEGRPWAAWATSRGFSRPTFPLARAVPGWLPDHSTFPQGYRARGHRSGADLSSRWSWGLPEGGGSHEDEDRTTLGTHDAAQIL